MTKNGFTLMEIMVALVIFSMISVGAFGVLTGLQRSQAELDAGSAQLETLQRVSLMAWHDISQASPHAPLSLPPSQPDTLAFASSHWPNPMQEARSNLAMIRYDSENNALVRQVWPFSASMNSPPALRQMLAESVTNVRFRSIAPVTTQKSPFPVAIEMAVTLLPFGEVVQLVPLVQKP